MMGECSVLITNQTGQTRTRMIVIKGRMDSLPLIGRLNLVNLGMVIIDETGRMSEQTRKVKKTSTSNQRLDEILLKYQDRFKGIGRA